MAVDLRGVCTLLQVFDMMQAVRFYREHLGFEVIQQSPLIEAPYLHFHWCLLEREGVQLMLNTAYETHERPAAPDPARFAAHDDTCLYFSCPDVDAAYADLRAQGLEMAPPKIAPYGMKQLYFKDLDGYGICLQWRA
jgi:catechol 2,3-dioxygenase-like lactoylglutathione lyase family enzyme